jgi:hypothetical protein
MGLALQWVSSRCGLLCCGSRLVVWLALPWGSPCSGSRPTVICNGFGGSGCVSGFDLRWPFGGLGCVSCLLGRVYFVNFLCDLLWIVWIFLWVVDGWVMGL